MDRKPSIGIAVITHAARDHLAQCLPPLLESPLRPRVVVVNSSSGDGTVEEALRLGAETLVLPRSEFNHGTTRERARKHLGTEIAVMTTPDAYAEDEHTVSRLAAPLLDGSASLSYARQIPHEGADTFESFSRDYNYPSDSHIRSIEDISLYGVYSIFCSNSFAAYRNDALDEIGGFQHVLLGEDTLAAAELLLRRRKIAYTADAIVRHSHRYSCTQEFKRHFDIGLARKQHERLINVFGQDNQRGKSYAVELMRRLMRESPLKLPAALAHLGAKWLGYRLGRCSVNAPRTLKKMFSSQDFFWVPDIA